MSTSVFMGKVKGSPDLLSKAYSQVDRSDFLSIFLWGKHELIRISGNRLTPMPASTHETMDSIDETLSILLDWLKYALRVCPKKHSFPKISSGSLSSSSKGVIRESFSFLEKRTSYPVNLPLPTTPMTSTDLRSRL